MARLEAVRDVCRTVAGRMRGTVEQGERNVAELRRKGDPEVDELVCSTTIVHNQSVTTSSNSYHNIEFRCSKIGLSIWLRKTMLSKIQSIICIEP
jgi:hypothetical protein